MSLYVGNKMGVEPHFLFSFSQIRFDPDFLNPRRKTCSARL